MLEEYYGCDCRGCACGSDVLSVGPTVTFDYRATGFKIEVMQFRSADPAGDPNPPVTFSVDISPDNIATGTMPDGYTGYTQESFEKYAWCGCSCAFEADRLTKQDTEITTHFGEVGIAVLGRTWQLECCVDQYDGECEPAIGETGPYVTCTDFRGDGGWVDTDGHSCDFYETSGICAGGAVEENPAVLEPVLTDAERNSSNWTTASYIANKTDFAGIDAAAACCWCGGGTTGDTFSRVCMNYYAENYYYGAYDGSGSQPPTNPADPDPPYGNLVDDHTCTFAYGCKNSSYLDYNSSAKVDDHSCTLYFLNLGAAMFELHSSLLVLCTITAITSAW